MIWKTVISTTGVDDEVVYHPPRRAVELEVIGGIAHLTLRDVEDAGALAQAEAVSIEVPARALLYALKAGMEDDEDDVPKALRQQY